MTTKPTREFSRDLVHNDQWPLFRARPAHEGSVDPVCAVTISWRASLTGRASLRQNVSSGLGNMLASLADKLKYSAIMYFVHRTLQPKSAIILHKRIWKSVPDHQLPTGTLSDEVAFECKSRIRFAAIARIAKIDIVPSILSRPDFDLIVPMLVPGELAGDSMLAFELTRLALGPDGCAEYSDFDWPKLVESISSKGGICVRETASEGTISLDFFATERIGKEVWEALSADDDLAGHR